MYDLDFEDKREISQYLIDNWDFTGTDVEEIELEVAIDNARENYANGRPIRWACTPTAAAEQKLELLFNGN